MQEDKWRQRLLTAIDASNRSLRDISLAAGLGENYISQMRNRGTRPKPREAVKLAEELGLSLSYLFAGIDVDPETEEMIHLLSRLPEDRRKEFLGILRAMQPSAAAPQEQLASHR